MSYQSLLYLLESLWVSELGQYQHENGQLVPSIRIIPPPIPTDIDFVPESGIAAAIWKTPHRDVKSQGGATIDDVWWKVYLAQRQTDASLDRAIALISKLIPSVRVTTAMQEKTQYTIKFERAIIKIPQWDEFDSEYILNRKDWLLSASSS